MNVARSMYCDAGMAHVVMTAVTIKWNIAHLMEGVDVPLATS